MLEATADFETGCTEICRVNTETVRLVLEDHVFVVDGHKTQLQPIALTAGAILLRAHGDAGGH